MRLEVVIVVSADFLCVVACSLLAISSVYLCLSLQGAVYWYILLHLTSSKKTSTAIRSGCFILQKVLKGVTPRHTHCCSVQRWWWFHCWISYVSLLCFENWQEQFIFEVLYIDICYSMQLSLAFLLHLWEVPGSNFDLEVTSRHRFSSALLTDGWSTWCCIVRSFFHVLSS